MKLVSIALLALIAPTVALADVPAGVENTQNPDDHPTPPEKALEKIQVPEGFRVTLFAAEPNVAQPIAMTFDDRGRLWVAECYSYRKWKSTGSDRILIFEDTDNDGNFDRRRVFMDQIANLSGIELGFGGVWICAAPKLLFIPDRDGDDRPDGPAETRLIGWDIKKAGHNIFNGLTWGPDGWLYGCQGIQSQSVVGGPTTAESERTAFNCGIWRYHPVARKFEVVAHGTTNPWGLDFDEYGQGFFTNCVIGHLWHLIPGACYKRMYGQHFNPHLYGLIDACSDHLHWGGGKWTESRNGKDEHSIAGGGHAHVGAMIYLGDNWPERYRGGLFTCNVHGNRVNEDRLVRKGSGYVGQHGKDFFFANDAWFRGLELKCGPDGGVYINDWCDFGECHDNDGVHRTSGRIFKVTYEAKRQKTAQVNLAKLDNKSLVQLQTHKNAWHGRHARRILHERAASGSDMSDAATLLLHLSKETDADARQRLRWLWSLKVIGAVDDKMLRALLADQNEHVRSWAVRWLTEQQADDSLVNELAKMARRESSALVRLHLASALQRLPFDHRWGIAEGLLTRSADAGDANLPLMIWYGIEPLVPADPQRAIRLAASCEIPLVRQFIARRAAAD